MPADPTALLFGAYRRQILQLLLRQPDLSLHVREIARRTGVPAGSLHRELRLLAEAGILERMPVDAQVRYRANPRCPLFEPLAAIFGGDGANDARPALRVAEATVGYGAPASRREAVLSRLKTERCLEIIGEAARALSPQGQQAYPQVPWRRLVGLRNRLSHEYGDVDYEEIFLIATVSVPELIAALEGSARP